MDGRGPPCYGPGIMVTATLGQPLILVLNGPNMNMPDLRQPKLRGAAHGCAPALQAMADLALDEDV